MKITIDGKQFEFEEKKTILDIARANGIFIPSLCDHHRLTPFTGCRLCIVEIKGRKGYPPSCGTYAEEGMNVRTKTPTLQKLRRQILELILSEHPHACLICSEKANCDEYKSTIRKVGETTGCVLCPNNQRCELQDVVEALEVERVRFPSLYRDFELKKNDPFFDRNYNLCILCGRCVRVCHEVRGASAVSFVYRGSQAVIGTVLDRPLLESGCQFCGACVDVCPTGALGERVVKYETLPERKARTICPLCSMGCELEVELKAGQILSSRPSANGAVNRGQACVKGRFLIRDVVHSPRRILSPMIRRNKKLEEASWEEALDCVARRLKNYRAKEVAFVSSSQVTCEDFFLFEKFAREALKTEHIFRASDFSILSAIRDLTEVSGLKSGLNFRMEDISRAKIIFLIGENLSVSHPLIWLEVLKAVREGARLVVASPFDFPMNRFASAWLRVRPGSEFHLFRFLSSRSLENGNAGDVSTLEGFDSFRSDLRKVSAGQVSRFTGLSEEELEEAARLFLTAGPTAILFGNSLVQRGDGTRNLASLWNLASLKDARLFALGLENNLRGVYEASRNSPLRSLPLSRLAELARSGQVKALYLAGPLPDLGQTKLEFVVVQDSFHNERAEMSDVVLPAATFAEVEGTFINTEGRLQKLEKVIEPRGDSRPDWWIVSQLAQKMGHQGFHFKNASAVMKEMSRTLPCFSKVSHGKFQSGEDVFVEEEKSGERKFVLVEKDRPRLEASAEFPLLMSIDYSLDYYRNLSLSQEAKGLRLIRDFRWIKISPQDAEKLKLKEGDPLIVESSSGKAEAVARISEAVPEGMVSASILWSESSDFSLTRLAFPASGAALYTNPLPVRLKRGK